MQPSDFRYDPFSDVSTAVMTTERHLIPSVSPYVISLNEVPQKTSPSTMTVTEIDTTGTAGTSFAEVAATPESGQFWADYNTGADGDNGWNTGKLLFAASDAGKLVEVSYTATGTLAGVKSNRYPAWWLDRGDGSDGDFRPTGNTTISGVKRYRSVYIPAGVTVTINRFAKIKCQGAFINLGVITVTPANLASFGAGLNGTTSVGGAGSAGNAGGYAGGAFFGLLDTTKDVLYYGASGGQGGNAYDGTDGGNGGGGGGSVCIIANSFRLAGSISAVGGAGGGNGSYAGAGGGGGGGAVIVVAHRIHNTGTCSVAGGAGGNAKAVAGGVGLLALIELGVD